MVIYPVLHKNTKKIKNNWEISSVKIDLNSSNLSNISKYQRLPWKKEWLTSLFNIKKLKNIRYSSKPQNNLSKTIYKNPNSL